MDNSYRNKFWYHGGVEQFSDWRDQISFFVDSCLASMPGWLTTLDSLNMTNRINCNCGMEDCIYRAKHMQAWEEMLMIASEEITQ